MRISSARPSVRARFIAWWRALKWWSQTAILVTSAIPVTVLCDWDIAAYKRYAETQADYEYPALFTGPISYVFGVFWRWLHGNHEVLIVIFTALIFGVTAVLARYTYRLWDSTAELVKTTDKTARTHERAYIFGSLEITGNPFVVMNCRNEGRTIAVTKSIQWGHCYEWELLPGVTISEIIDKALIPSANVQDVALEDVLVPDTPRGRLFWEIKPDISVIVGRVCFGRIIYEDVFRGLHHSTFKFRIGKIDDNPNGIRLTPLSGCYSDWG